MSTMTKNEECLVKILQQNSNSLTTNQILKATKEFPDLCNGCSSGTQVISAGLSLYKKGVIQREVTQGGFVWSLNSQ